MKRLLLVSLATLCKYLAVLSAAVGVLMLALQPILFKFAEVLSGTKAPLRVADAPPLPTGHGSAEDFRAPFLTMILFSLGYLIIASIVSRVRTNPERVLPPEPASPAEPSPSPESSQTIP